MPLSLQLQIASTFIPLPKKKQFQQWAQLALPKTSEKQELTIRIVDEPESAQLNSTYRHKNYPTNVLSFPMDAPVPTPLLGDLVICAPIVAKEALAQNKSLEAHFAHMTVHGVLHLLGYDHMTDDEAETMETLEIGILEQLGYGNPYQ